MNYIRIVPKGVLLPNGQVLAIGGIRGYITELYDPVHNTWTPAASVNTGRIAFAATVIPGGQVVVTGGDQTEYNGPPIASIETYGTADFPPLPAGVWDADGHDVQPARQLADNAPQRHGARGRRRSGGFNPFAPVIHRDL